MFSRSLLSSNSRTVKVVDWKACMKVLDCMAKWTVECNVREGLEAICHSMDCCRAWVNCSPGLSRGIMSRCCRNVASNHCLFSTFLQL